MMSTLSRYWWMLALRGAVAILYGIMALFWPGLTLPNLVQLFGICALFDGILAVTAGLTAKVHNERWWGPVLQGIFVFILGIRTLFYPGTTALILLYFIAAWAFFTVTFAIVPATQLRQVFRGEWFMIIAGLLTIIFAGLQIAFPDTGALGLLWLIGVYAVLAGLLLIILAFRLRPLRGAPTTVNAARARGRWRRDVTG